MHVNGEFGVRAGFEHGDRRLGFRRLDQFRRRTAAQREHGDQRTPRPLAHASVHIYASHTVQRAAHWSKQDAPSVMLSNHLHESTRVGARIEDTA